MDYGFSLYGFESNESVYELYIHHKKLIIIFIIIVVIDQAHHS